MCLWREPHKVGYAGYINSITPLNSRWPTYIMGNVGATFLQERRLVCMRKDNISGPAALILILFCDASALKYKALTAIINGCAPPAQVVRKTDYKENYINALLNNDSKKSKQIKNACCTFIC